MAEGGKILTGGKLVQGEGNFVQPTIIASKHNAKSMPSRFVLFFFCLSAFSASFLLFCASAYVRRFC